MFLMGLGALLVLGGGFYMARAAIWRGSLSGPDSSRPVRGTLEPPRRSLRFLGLGTNWPGILLMVIGAILLVSGAGVSPRHQSQIGEVRMVVLQMTQRPRSDPGPFLSIRRWLVGLSVGRSIHQQHT